MFYRLGKRKKCYFIFFFLFIFISSLPLPIFATEEHKIIRVGYYPLENYHSMDESGNMAGYEIEYLNKIAEKTGWEYEYIKADSWSEAIEMLRKGEIDLLSPAQIVGNRLQEFGFSSMPIGKIYGGIVTLENSDILYEDFESFSQMTFGIEKGVSFSELFETYANENHFTPTMVTYENHEALLKALEAKEIDAAVSNIMRVKENQKLLGRFGTSSCYFMFRKNDTYLEERLNFALYKIDLEFPNYQNDLISRYFSIYSMEFITKNEMEYINALDELVIGYPSNMDPIAYIDEKTGKPTGITKEILDLVAERTGLRFRYEPLPEGSITYDYLREHHIDMVACAENNSINYNTSGIRLSSPYLTSQKVLVGRKGINYDENSSLIIAVSTGSQTFVSFIQSYYPNFKVKLYDNIEACLKAMENGEADVMLQNQYTVVSYLAKPQYEHLEIIPSVGIPERLSLSILLTKEGSGIEDSVLSDRRLISILNKGIMNVTENEISRIIISYTTNRPYKFHLKDFLYQYRYTIQMLIFCIIIAVGISVYAIQLRRKSLALLRKSERRLLNITNNINGGVVVLLPNEGFKITYANEGFLDLIQYSKEEFADIADASYTMYIHEDDIASIQEILSINFVQDKQISIRIRIRRKDGSYIPTRFNGTVSIGEHGHLEIYCVIVDISQEISMLESLAFEQKKHNLIVEKANEILYEIDLSKRELHVSDTFQKMFGWTFNNNLQNTSLQDWINSWKIPSEDTAALIDMFQNTIYSQKDGSCNIRIMDSAHTYRWCHISQYPMQNANEEVCLIIGKITDIDDEVKEKLSLEEKSQLDTTTGLYNKEAFLTSAAQYLEKNPNIPSALVFLDLDHFKNINDLLGHMTGDTAIIDASRVLKSLFSDGHLISRFGGDEFCILLKNISREVLEEKLNLALKNLSHTYQNAAHSVTITSSIGAAYSADYGHDIHLLLEYADKALYAIKENGKNNFMIYHDGIELKGYHGRR